MSRALIFISILMLSLTAGAFQDVTVAGQITLLKEEFARENNPNDRLTRLDVFRDSLDRYLQGENSNWGPGLALPKTNAEKMEFASLSEFASALFGVRMKEINPANCQAAWNKIQKEDLIHNQMKDGAQMALSPTTNLVLDLLLSVCGKDSQRP